MFWKWHDFRKKSQQGVISLRRSASLTGKPSRHLEEVQGCRKSRTPKATAEGRDRIQPENKGVPSEKRAACTHTGASPAAPGGRVKTHAGPQLQAPHSVGGSEVRLGTWISEKLQGNGVLVWGTGFESHQLSYSVPSVVRGQRQGQAQLSGDGVHRGERMSVPFCTSERTSPQSKCSSARGGLD